MKFVRLIAVSLFASLVATSASAATILYGKEFSFHHEFRGTQYWAEDFVVGDGVEVAPGPTNPNRPRYYTIDISDNQLRFEMGPYNFNQNFGFNGIVLRDTTDNLPDFRSITLLSENFGGTISTSISENEFRIDFGASGTGAGRVAVFEIEVASVPLPGSISMLALAIGGGFVLARRRKAISN